MTALELSNHSFTLTFFVYVAALVVSLVASVGQHPRLQRLGFFGFLAGLAGHTLGLGARWWAAGLAHPPMTDIYETLMFFVWGLLLVSLYFEWRHAMRVQRIPALLLAVVGMGLAALQPSRAIEPLVPALQSMWLHVHVAFAAFSYGFFLLSAVFAFLYVIKVRENQAFVGLFLSGFVVFCLLVVGGKGSFLLGDVVFNQVKLDEGVARPSSDVLAVPYLNYLFALATLLQLISAFLQWRQTREGRNVVPGPSYALKATGWCSGLVLIGLWVWVAGALTGTEGLSLVSNPYRLAILGFGTVAFATQFALLFTYARLRQHLPPDATLEQLSYKAILLGLPLLTLVIGTGSVWAHFAWGRYWGWDPKETWSFITWLIYAIYLHLRLQKRWQGERLAIVAIIGFFAVIFTYLGVNILLSGLHSYAA